jgi:hypothetical protein
VLGYWSWWMIIKIPGIQIFTEIEISIFEKVIHFLKNRVKKWEHPKFFWYDETCLIKDQKKNLKIKTSQSQTVAWVCKWHFWWLTWYGIARILKYLLLTIVLFILIFANIRLFSTHIVMLRKDVTYIFVVIKKTTTNKCSFMMK